MHFTITLAHIGTFFICQMYIKQKQHTMSLAPNQYRSLSKTLSYALRHHPDSLNLQLDELGWASLTDVINALQQRKKFAQLTIADIHAMMAASNKQRYEIEGQRIRAVYGHSLRKKIAKQASVPPVILYHGTSRKAFNNIQHEGLKSMQRQYVHLSADIETALIVAKRHDSKPVLLKVAALLAHNNGVAFYAETNGIWLSEAIAPHFINVDEGE